VDKDRLIRIEEKLDSLNEKLQETNITLAENTQSLIVHEKRTDLAEKKLELVENRLERQIDKDRDLLERLGEKLKPIEEHVNMVNVVFKYVIPTLSAILLFLVKLDVIKL
jgi:CII-binding regulator of phage lambda lysogenization HflD